MCVQGRPTAPPIKGHTACVCARGGVVVADDSGSAPGRHRLLRGSKCPLRPSPLEPEREIIGRDGLYRR
eukprot:1256127-Alexandrium_andersonii.AAC.1